MTDHQGFLVAMQPLLNQLRSVLGRMLHRAFPDSGHTPAKRPKHFHVSRVAVDIALELSLPELFVGLRRGGVATAVVSMPETAVNEHHRPVDREHKVWRAGQLSDMKSIAKPLGEKKRTKGSLRLGVLSANARHHAAALRGGRDAHDLGTSSLDIFSNRRVTHLSVNPTEGTEPLEG